MYREAILEMLRDLSEAPDAVRDRFAEFLVPPEGALTTSEARLRPGAFRLGWR